MNTTIQIFLLSNFCFVLLNFFFNSQNWVLQIFFINNTYISFLVCFLIDFNNFSFFSFLLILLLFLIEVILILLFFFSNKKNF